MQTSRQIRQALPGIEESELRHALVLANGSPTKAAELLGISRMTVWRRIKKYGIERVVKPAA